MPTIPVGPEDRRYLQEIADILARSKKVIVVTGAGISTNCGIPVSAPNQDIGWMQLNKSADLFMTKDFRSENGLYSLIQTHYTATRPASLSHSTSTSRPESTSRPAVPPKLKGRDLFDSRVWKDPLTTSVFYTFIASLRKSIREYVKHTTPTHKFIRTLRDGGRLVRNYSQNIDGLEARLGLCTDLSRGKGNRARFTKRVVGKPRPLVPALPGSESDGGCEVVQLHGDLNDLRCTLCLKLCEWAHEEEHELLGGQAPLCTLCVTNDDNRRGRGKRGTAVGTLRPNIILYGEEHPLEHALSQIITHDIALAPDVLLILGTSLRVHGLKVLVKEFAKAVHARKTGKGRVIFINRTKPSESGWNEVIDWWVGMDCDEWVHDLHGRRSDLWERQGMLQLSVVKRAGSASKEYARSKELDMPEEEVDKENIPIRSELGNLTNHIALDMESKKPQTAEKSLKRKGLERRRGATAKVPLSTVATENIREAEPYIAESPEKLAPVTPLKTRISKFDSEQLPTPPASRRVSPGSRKVSAQALQGTVDDANVLTSPSKRKRNSVEIWVDTLNGDCEAEETETVESQEIQFQTFPRRMKMVELLNSGAMGSPSKGKKQKLTAA